MHSIFCQGSQEGSEKLAWINQNKGGPTSIISGVILLFLPCATTLGRQTAPCSTILLLIRLTCRVEILSDSAIDSCGILSNNFALTASAFSRGSAGGIPRGSDTKLGWIGLESSVKREKVELDLVMQKNQQKRCTGPKFRF
jgi:hypothetical protein